MSSNRRRSDEQGELIKGNTPTLILSVLQESPLHGYAIARLIEKLSGELLTLGEGSLYPALRALEGEGLVVSQWEPQSSGPVRKTYSLTDAGRAELTRRIQSWRRFARAINAVLGDSDEEQPGYPITARACSI
jgi:DNA-binding PadR family transcriptional regulator